MKLIQTKKFVLCAAVLSLSVACGEPEEKSIPTEDDPSGFVNSGGVAVGNSKIFSIIGTWALEHCTNEASASLQTDGAGGDENDDSEDNTSDQEYSKESFAFKSDGTLDVTIKQFLGVDCTNQMMEMAFKADYIVGAEITATPPVKELDMTMTSGTFTVMAQEAVDLLNGVGNSLVQQSDAGASDDGDGGGGGDDFPCTKTGPWVLNETVSLADMTCSEGFTQIGQKMFDAVSVAGNLMMMTKDDGGSVSGMDGKTAETRNTAIETDAKKAYLKQLVAE